MTEFLVKKTVFSLKNIQKNKEIDVNGKSEKEGPKLGQIKKSSSNKNLQKNEGNATDRPFAAKKGIILLILL